MRRTIPVELKDQCIKIYEETLDNEEADIVAIKKMQELFNMRGEPVGERTLYRWLNEWKKSGTLSTIMETFEVELERPKYIAERVMEKLFTKFEKSADKEDTHQREVIGWADALGKYLELVVKIEVLRSKKVTSVDSKDETAKIVINGV